MLWCGNVNGHIEFLLLDVVPRPVARFPMLLCARLAAVVETLLLASAHEQAELFQGFIPGRLTEFVILVVDGESRRLATAAADRLADAGAELRPVLLFEHSLLLPDLP